MTENKKIKRGCSSSKGCSGCSSKLNVFDWLKDVPPGIDSQDIVEVQFKSTNKDFFLNVDKIPLKVGDNIVVEASPGHDTGTVSAVGEIVLKQLKKKKVSARKEFKKIYRKATEADIEKWDMAIAREEEVMLKARKLATGLSLDMKIGDVEFKGDGSKAIFYYIADKRVDFRELIRVLAAEFKIRIEMKQIGARQEAGRIGGIGSCGRELCCSSWKTDFETVSTDAARLQELGLNPDKLTGQCGKLKCCLNFEIDNYIDALKNFPQKRSLESKAGRARYVKRDILQGTMLYTMEVNNLKTYITLPIERVKEIQAMNKAGEQPEKLLIVDETLITENLGYKNVIGEESLTRFDNLKSKKQKPRRKKNNNRKKRNPQNKQEGNNKQTSTQKTVPKKKNNRRKRPNKPANKQGGNKPAVTPKNPANKKHSPNKRNDEKK